MFSMAGLRLGYMLCPDMDIVKAVFSTGQSWSVSTPAQVAGAAAMKLYDRPEKTREVSQAGETPGNGENEKTWIKSLLIGRELSAI